MSDTIKRVELAGGRVRYRFVIDLGPDPDTGKRRQRTHTFDTLREARAEHARIRHQTSRGTYVPPSRLTVAQLLDLYLAEATRDVEAGTGANYRHALRPVRDLLGGRTVQSLTEDDVDQLVDWMLRQGRRRGGRPGTGLGARTVALTLGQLRAALNLGVRRQLLVRNVAQATRIPRQARKDAAAKRADRALWTADEVRTFLAAVSGDRLAGPLMLSALGLRPAEVCGLTWDHVDVKISTPTVRVEVTRTLVDGAAVVKGPKTAAGRRTLPLPDAAVAALREWRARQATERLAAGPAWAATGYVLTDDSGRPFRTDQFRRRLYRLMTDAGVRRVTPYAMRHACLTYLAANGVPDVVVSAWAGHTDLSLAKRVYVHPDATHLAAAAIRLDQLLAPSAAR